MIMKEIESWKDKKWVPNSKIGTNLWDAHYFFGWAVFDAFRTYKHEFHMLDCHLDRFYKSAKLTGINIPFSKPQLIEKINEVVVHNKEFFENDEYRFMVFASPGYFKIYDDMGDAKPSLTINVTTTSRYAKHIYPYLDTGVTSVITHQQQIPYRFFDPKIKSCSRLHYGLADVEASKYGAGAHPILLDEHGFISESSGSNVGFIKEGSLFLPENHDILCGCTMQFIKKIAKDRDIDIVIGNWCPYDIVFSDGIIFTSAFAGILPSWNIVYKNSNYELNRKKGEYIFNKLMEGYSFELGVNVKEQWRKWYERSL